MERRMVVARADCPARRVPDGTPLTIPKDTFVTITQALGGNYTVTYNGQMVRVDGTDAEALGLEPELLSFPEPTDDQIREEQVWEALKTVYDPEIPVNIVDLGLIYDVQVNGSDVYVQMTLTAPGCGMGTYIAQQAEWAIQEIEGVEDVQIELVFEPAWTPDLISEEARSQMGI